MNNIYIETLKLGFENPEGISLQEIANKLNINLEKGTQFNYYYIIWFYDNFYNYNLEQFVANRKNPMGRTFRMDSKILDEIVIYHKIESIIKGDAVNKYIDYLELERTRKSSKQASIYSTISIILAFIAILISLVLNPKQPYEVKIIEDSDYKKIVIPKLIKPNQSIISEKDTVINIVPNKK